MQAVEIKQLSAQLASIKSDINRQEDVLEECASYEAFLAQLTPQAWLEVRSMRKRLHVIRAVCRCCDACTCQMSRT